MIAPRCRKSWSVNSVPEHCGRSEWNVSHTNTAAFPVKVWLFCRLLAYIHIESDKIKQWRTLFVTTSAQPGSFSIKTKQILKQSNLKSDKPVEIAGNFNISAEKVENLVETFLYCLYLSNGIQKAFNKHSKISFRVSLGCTPVLFILQVLLLQCSPVVSTPQVSPVLTSDRVLEILLRFSSLAFLNIHLALFI